MEKDSLTRLYLTIGIRYEKEIIKMYSDILKEIDNKEKEIIFGTSNMEGVLMGWCDFQMEKELVELDLMELGRS